MDRIRNMETENMRVCFIANYHDKVRMIPGTGWADTPETHYLK